MLSNLNTSINDLSHTTIVGLNGRYRGAAYDTITGITISTAAQFQAWREWAGLADGSFSNIRLGDTLMIEEGGKATRWVVAGFNYYTRKGSTADLVLSTNHVVLITSGVYLGGTGTSSQIFRLHDSTDLPGGYAASEMATTTLPAIETRLTAIMGNNLKTREALYSYNFSSTGLSGYCGDSSTGGHLGTSTTWSWIQVKVTLPTLAMLGLTHPYSGPYEMGIDNNMLPIFNYITANSMSRSNFWTSNLAYNARAILVNNNGRISAVALNGTYSIKPVIVID